MNNWVTKYWVPFLLISLCVAVFMEFNSVKSIDLESGAYKTGSSGLQNMKSPLMQRAAPEQKPHEIASRLVLGEHYSSLQELVADQQAAGFVRTGYFGKFWPATVTEITTDDDGISFVRQNGTRHNYTNFDGYRMKMIRLRAGASETIVVFRSQSKR